MSELNSAQPEQPGTVPRRRTAIFLAPESRPTSMKAKVRYQDASSRGHAERSFMLFDGARPIVTTPCAAAAFATLAERAAALYVALPPKSTLRA